MRRAVRRSMVAGLYSEKSTPVLLRTKARILSKLSSSFSDGGGEVSAVARYGCRPSRTSSRASAGMGSPVSTTPAAMALAGMSANFAVSGDCAKVMPPSALMARNPFVPSAPLPDSTTPMACAPRCAARL